MRRAVVALALLAAGPAWADPLAAPEASATLPSPAQELVAQAEAADLFEVLPSEQSIVVRHTRSGLICRMDARASNRIVVFPQAARGEDVACDSTLGGESTTLYATRFSFETTVRDQIQGAEAAIRQRFPNARALTPSEEQGAAQTVEFAVTRDGTPMYTRASIAIVNGWTIKLRYTAAAPDADATERARAVASELWRTVLSEIASGRVS